jgi:hypothetical protein
MVSYAVKPFCVCGHRKSWHPLYKRTGLSQCRFIECDCDNYRPEPEKELLELPELPSFPTEIVEEKHDY